MLSGCSTERCETLLAEAETCLRRLGDAAPTIRAALASWHALPVRLTTEPAALNALALHARSLALAVATSDRLSREGIPHAILKGPALQEANYRDAAIRAYSDLDVATTRDTFASARRCLLADGWNCTTPAWARPVHFHHVFRRPDQPVPIELHRSLVDKANFYRMPHDDIIRRAVRLATPAGPLPVLAPPDRFVYHCLHAAKHGFLTEAALWERRSLDLLLHPGAGNRLLWLLDIALDLETGFDLVELLDVIADWNIASPIATTLTLVAHAMPSSRAHAALGALGLKTWTPRKPGRWERRLLDALSTSRGLRTATSPEIRPARLVQLPRLLFPDAATLKQFARCESAHAGMRLRHLAVMARRLLEL